ncbi:hypothetical protein F751_1362 [Auxenochlorella protothecoides]|uniref:Uncharacterized protein n=1 Tax=Auxenochlorella protothecoides TaxID=3075 RepID=A0A087SEE3_AUXPR|nr:hypothetical protein F751_1362 [Auxenochlorella protothecoides]KFM24097.1 hypothetical protein F751_1362 [Auxenochlorella protothecoides]
MAISNFVITIVGLGAVAYLMKSDIRGSSAMLRRNLKHIRGWMEEQGAAAECVVLAGGRFGEHRLKGWWSSFAALIQGGG